MKKITTLLLTVVFLLGCNEKPLLPLNAAKDVTYGKSVVKIPGLALEKIALSNVVFKFSLTITGNDMEPMNFTWPVKESGATFTIDRIPSGKSRLFEGLLYGSDGTQYEGRAYADIIGGKVANVSLVLRKTGSANVEVIIEDLKDEGTLEGCWGLMGRVGSTEITKLSIEIPPYINNTFFGYVKDGQKKIGKFYGSVTNGLIKANFNIPEPYDIQAVFKGKMSDKKNFKGEMFSDGDAQPNGSMLGYAISCETVELPQYGNLTGCWGVNGTINEIDLSQLSIMIPAYIGVQFYGYIREAQKEIGKFQGTVTDGKIEIIIKLPAPYNLYAKIIGEVSKTGTEFKGSIHSIDDPSKVGTIYGNKVSCSSNPPPTETELLYGCWSLKGTVNKIDMSAFSLQIPKYKYGSFNGYILEGENKIGKFSGSEKDGKVTANFYIPSPYDINTQFQGVVSVNGTAFKGTMLSNDKSSEVGTIWANAIDCNIVPPSAACKKDTLGGIGSTSCKDKATWIKYATNECLVQNKKLTKYEFISKCDEKDDAFYEGICFECCQ